MDVTDGAAAVAVEGVDFRALFEASPCLDLVLDPELTVVAASDAYLVATATARKDLVGRDVFEVFADRPAASVRDLRASLERVRRTGEPDTMPERRSAVRRPGAAGDCLEERCRRLVNIPVTGRDAQLAYIVHRIELVHLEPADPAAQLHNAFLARMSHELRTPLAAIVGFSELLGHSGLDEEKRAWVDLIGKAGAHLVLLVDEVLDLSRIESGHLPISLDAVAVRPLLTEALDLMRPLAAMHDVMLLPPVFSAGGGCVRADDQRLKQVVINLVSNAIKYNRCGGEVRVAVGADGERVRIVVEDTGHGIEETLLERLFVPFERLHAAGSDVPGTGLGLALSRNLVEAMGGTLGVASTLGEGSTFWIELDGARPAAVEREVAAGAALHEPGGGSARRLLCIEETIANVRLIEEVLGHRPSIRLVPAMLGRLGLDLARESKPHLILLDLHLPELEGAAALDRPQACEATRGIPVVILSADVTGQQLDRLHASGATAYVTKPMGMRRLLEVVDEFLAVPHG